MVTSIMTLFLGVAIFAMMTQPLFWCYGGAGQKLLNEGYKKISAYEGIKFDSNQDIYYTVGCVFLIIALAFTGLMLLCTVLSFIGRKNVNGKRIGAKFAAYLLFISMTVAVVLFTIFIMKSTKVTGVTNAPIVSIGWSLMAGWILSLLTLFLAPKRKRKK